MNFVKKQILWLMMFGMICLPMQALEETPKKYTQTMNCNESMAVNSQAKQEEKPTYFEKVGNYLQSESFMSKIFGFTGNISLVVITAYIYMYVQQHTKDTIGNQTMEIYYPGEITCKLTDVAGLAGAKADMQDIISYLANPKMYNKIGAKIPKGVLMNGGPGNGKTLLAKAVAGTVNCPFISVAGSSFVQMFAGLGAARVRDLFAMAQQLAVQYGGCIIFIDEIDALARKRSVAGGGVDREHDQTVAQLLECMDGLQKTKNPVIVLGATNRAELLDPAVVRPGRFDRKVEITKPYKKDRIALAKIALDAVIHDKNIDIDRLAGITGGFSGAQLATLINEAAILAVAHGRKSVANQDLELAFDHIVLGREIKGMDQSNEAKWSTAIHEAGHAVGWLFGNNPKYIIHKASITPRSHTLGVVYATQLNESYSSTETEMKSRIVVSLCGGLAEQEFGFGKSNGLSNDLAQARAIAYDMVVKYGMSEKLNYISYDEIDHRLPNDIATEVHKEVQKIVDECFIVAKKLIASHKKEIEMIAKLLMEKGTVLGDEIYTLVGFPVPKIEVKLTV